ncbi:MAG TPA: hypothetical protein VGA78_11350 [Gemmatimonadales bacterium]
MPKRIIEVDGRRWSVSPSGRRTQYVKDEFGIVFTSEDERREQRIARYSPLAAKSTELSLSALTDRELSELLSMSQPAWTSPELGYRR